MVVLRTPREKTEKCSSPKEKNHIVADVGGVNVVCMKLLV